MEGRADGTTGAPHTGQIARLAVRSEGETMRSVPVTGELSIGSAPENDLVLDGGQVAGRHARIYARDGGLFLCNEGTATTGVNGVTLIGHRRLRDGDRIKVGGTLLIYHAAEAPRQASGPATGPAAGPAGEAADEDDDLALLATLRSTLPAPGTRPRFRLPWRAPTPRTGQGRQRSPSIVLTPAGLVVLVAVAAIVAYLISPDSFDRRRTDKRLTPVIAASAPDPAVSPRAQATAGTTVSGLSVSPPASAAAPTADQLVSFLAEAETLTLRSQFDAAIERYQSLAERTPRDARVEAGWALALILDGDVEQGLSHALNATEIDPDSALAWIALTRAYIAGDDTSEALSAGRRAVALSGDDGAARAHAVLAEAYLIGGLLPQAVEHADIAVSYEPAVADALSIRGRLYLLVDGDAAAAVAALQRAAILEPELWVRHHELGLMLLDLGQYRPAVQALTQAMVLCREPVTYTALGRAHYYLGEYDQGKSYLEQSLSLGTDDVETYALLAAMNAEQGRCDDARVYYGLALEREFEYPLALQARALCERGPTASQPDAAAASTPGAVATSTPGILPTPGVPTSTPPGVAAAPPLSGWIAFSTWNTALGHYDTYVARPDGSDRRLVATQMHQPAFRPDPPPYPEGQWLALNGERPLHMNLHIARLNGGEPVEITAYLEDRLPRWSPDGKSLIFSSTRHTDRQPRLYIVDEALVDGRRLEDRPVRADLYEVLGDYPTWMPDGRIVYTGCDWSRGTAQCGLLAVSSEPGAQTLQVLTEYPGDTAAAAGPGGQIAFMSDRDGNWEVYLLDADGEVRRLTQHAANDGLPAWSPAGDYVAFVSDREGVWAVWAVRPDGSGLRKLFDLGDGGLAVDWHYESISWGR